MEFGEFVNCNVNFHLIFLIFKLIEVSLIPFPVGTHFCFNKVIVERKAVRLLHLSELDIICINFIKFSHTFLFWVSGQIRVCHDANVVSSVLLKNFTFRTTAQIFTVVYQISFLNKMDNSSFNIILFLILFYVYRGYLMNNLHNNRFIYVTYVFKKPSCLVIINFIIMLLNVYRYSIG